MSTNQFSARSVPFTEEELRYIWITYINNEEGTGKNIRDKVAFALGYPEPLERNQKHSNIAKLMMRAIQYENGMVNRYEPETFPQKWVDMITLDLNYFFMHNPSLYPLSNEMLEAIANYSEDEDEENLLMHLEGFDRLNNTLNFYFDHFPEEEELQGDWVRGIFSKYGLTVLNGHMETSTSPTKSWGARCRRCGVTIADGHPQICLCDRRQMTLEEVTELRALKKKRI